MGLTASGCLKLPPARISTVMSALSTACRRVGWWASEGHGSVAVAAGGLLLAARVRLGLGAGLGRSFRNFKTALDFATCELV